MSGLLNDGPRICAISGADAGAGAGAGADAGAGAGAGAGGADAVAVGLAPNTKGLACGFRDSLRGIVEAGAETWFDAGRGNSPFEVNEPEPSRE